MDCFLKSIIQGLNEYIIIPQTTTAISACKNALPLELILLGVFSGGLIFAMPIYRQALNNSLFNLSIPHNEAFRVLFRTDIH